jgi:hypothetical protein
MDTLSPDHEPTVASASLLTASQLADASRSAETGSIRPSPDDVLPHVRLGDDLPIRFIAAEIDAWLEQRRGRTPGRGRPRKRGRG